MKDLACIAAFASLGLLLVGCGKDSTASDTDTGGGDGDGDGDGDGAGDGDGDGDGGGDGDGDGDGTGDGDGDGDGDCPPTWAGTAEPVFDQTIDLFEFNAEPAWWILDGAVFDGDELPLFDEAEREGMCRLLTHEPSACDPLCDPEEACVDGECLPHPLQVAVGTLSLDDVGPTTIEIEPTAQNRYYWYDESPAAGGLDQVSISAPGAGETSPFTLTACAPEPVEPESDWSELLMEREDGADVTLTWSNPDTGARVYLRMTTGIGTHGGISPVEIECEGPDLGALTLPGAFLDALYSPGYWSCGECGGNDLHRYHAQEIDAGEDTVQLRVQATTSFWHIPGLGP